MLLPPRIAKRKVRLLESELQMLQKYKTDASLLFDEYSKEYIRDMNYIEERISSAQTDDSPGSSEAPDTLSLDPSVKEQHWEKTKDGWERREAEGSGQDSSPDEDMSIEDKVAAPDWAKKLYRKIALITHPDRSSEEFQEEKLRKIFLETSDAMSSGDFEKLLGFALELGVQDMDADVTMVPLLQKRVVDIKSEISEMESKAEWLWGEGLGAHPMRANIARLYFTRRGIDVKTEDLLSIIEKMEKDNESRSQVD